MKTVDARIYTDAPESDRVLITAWQLETDEDIDDPAYGDKIVDAYVTAFEFPDDQPLVIELNEIPPPP